MKVVVQDENGDNFTITFEGKVTRDKALRIFDIVELLGGMSNFSVHNSNNLSKIQKLRNLLEKQFPIVWFSAKEVQEVYEKEVKEPITHSTVSTYLSRLTDRSLLTKSKKFNKILYKISQHRIEKIAKHT